MFSVSDIQALNAGPSVPVVSNTVSIVTTTDQTVESSAVPITSGGVFTVKSALEASITTKQDVTSDLTAIVSAEESDQSITGVASLFTNGLLMNTNTHLTSTIDSATTTAAPTSAAVHSALATKQAITSDLTAIIDAEESDNSITGVAALFTNGLVMNTSTHLTSTIDSTVTTAAPTSATVHSALATKQAVTSDLTSIISAEESDNSVTGVAALFSNGLVMNTNTHLTTTIDSTVTTAAPTSATVHTALASCALSSDIPPAVKIDKPCRTGRAIPFLAMRCTLR